MHHSGAPGIIPALIIHYHGTDIQAPVHLMNCTVWAT
jgi:hypothetical protein